MVVRLQSYRRAYRTVPLLKMRIRRFSTVTSCRKERLESGMKVSGIQSNDTRRPSTLMLSFPGKTSLESRHRWRRKMVAV